MIIESKFQKGDHVYVLHNSKICSAKVIGMMGFIDDAAGNSVELKLSVSPHDSKAKKLIDMPEQNVYSTREELINDL
jgi:hypothetical protein